MTHLDERQIFSIRYGVNRETDSVWADKHPWGSRHRSETALPAHGCACRGIGLGNGHCSQRATQEDLRCDECRKWCGPR